jgi:hypothetical protein
VPRDWQGVRVCERAEYAGPMREIMGLRGQMEGFWRGVIAGTPCRGGSLTLQDTLVWRAAAQERVLWSSARPFQRAN